MFSDMSEEKHNDLYEKVGRLTGLAEVLAKNQTEMQEEIKEIKKLLSENNAHLSSLKTRVATISGGIGTVVTLGITFIWNFITGIHK